MEKLCYINKVSASSTNLAISPNFSITHKFKKKLISSATRETICNKLANKSPTKWSQVPYGICNADLTPLPLDLNRAHSLTDLTA